MASSAPDDTKASSAARPAAASATASSSTRAGPSAGSPSYRVTQPRRAPPKRVLERSCIVCHRRKVKCDKTMPCANCVRSGVLCCYPSNKRAPRQPKTTIADIASRLVQLERTIVAVAGGDAAGDDNAGYESDTAPAPSTNNGHTNGHANNNHATEPEKRPVTRVAPASLSVALAAHHRDFRRSITPHGGPGDDDTASWRDGTQSESGAAAQEILLHNAYASRYINELLLSRILEEEEEFRSALASPKETEADETFDTDASETSAPAVTLFGTLTNSRYIPRNPSLRNSNSKLHPPKRQAMQLWNAYLHNVEPMNKVLHVPTAQISVFTAIHTPEKTEPAFESLLFSIYYATVTAYQPEEYRAAFGEDKAVGLDRYRAGMERALVQARFLESPSLPTLQALTLFLRTSRAHSAGQSIWVLYGMVLRLAQSIGLHRDGANFNLSPFEAEIRRRVWGHMIKQDDRSAEDHGIDVGLPDTDVDIQEALNINDSDIHPDIKELPTPLMHWTEMTIPVCIRRLGITVAYIFRLLTEMKASQYAGTPGYPSASWFAMSPDLPLTEERRRTIMTERNQYVEDLLKQCNMVVPLQRATYKMVRLIQLKFDFVTRLQLATILARGSAAGSGDDAAGANDGSNAPAVIATEEHLVLACEVIELNVDIMEDDLIQDFRWTAEIYPQYHTLLYVLWHLCVQPVPNNKPALRDRAWAVADGMYAMEDARQKRQNVRGRNSKWAMLMALRDKAVKVRAAMDLAEKGGKTSGGTAGKSTQAQASTQTAGGPVNGSGGQDIHMDDGSSRAIPATGVPPAPAAVANTPLGNVQGATVFENAAFAAPYGPLSAATTGTLASGTTAVDPTSVGSATFVQSEQLADADMAEFLGESTLGMGMDMDWVRGFMDWNAVADDFRMRSYDAGT
ncbi:hypothetical protein SEUCBS139899_006960 [Sporothrix eucalyptigena]